MYTTEEPSNEYPMTPRSLPTFNDASRLNCLRLVDSLYVKQRSSLSEAVFGFASEAKFDIFNNKNEQILHAIESSTFWQRCCCTTRRRFTLRILDNNNQDIILIKREFKCCSGCCWCAGSQCCSQEITAESPLGILFGTVSQTGSCCRSNFAIRDANDNQILTLLGPLAICDGPLSCCCENKFTLIGTDGITEMGAIYKKYRGFLAESMTSGDAYLLQFPMDLDVKMKVMSLAALFLIEYMMFSSVPNNNRNQN